MRASVHRQLNEGEQVSLLAMLMCHIAVGDQVELYDTNWENNADVYLQDAKRMVAILGLAGFKVVEPVDA